MKAVVVEDVTGLTPREIGMRIRVLQATYPNTLFYLECRDDHTTIMRGNPSGGRR